MTMTEIIPTWSPQQAKALLEVNRWFKEGKGKQVFKLEGYAGTGKTTLARHFAAQLPSGSLVLFAAYTGKAASVLKQMGCPGASTLHSLLYSVSEHDRTRLVEAEDELRKLKALPLEEQDGHYMDILEQQIQDLRKKLNQPRFTLNADSILNEATLVVVDESSMIDEYLAKDLESFGKKILVMGDPAQLPPVKGFGHYSRGTPDILLTEIHRQARDNPILRFATLARQGKDIPVCEWGDARKVHRTDWDEKAYNYAALEGAQILTGKNATRRKINRNVRHAQGYSAYPYPREGERLVVLRNDKDIGVLNGVVCTAADNAEDLGDGDEELLISLDYEGARLSDIAIDRMPFDIYEAPVTLHKDLEWQMGHPDRRWMIPLDYAYALTVHKAQGSQWPEVVVADDGFGWNDAMLRRQWLYTAITRAQQTLTIVGS